MDRKRQKLSPEKNDVQKECQDAKVTALERKLQHMENKIKLVTGDLEQVKEENSPLKSKIDKNREQWTELLYENERLQKRLQDLETTNINLEEKSQITLCNSDLTSQKMKIEESNDEALGINALPNEIILKNFGYVEQNQLGQIARSHLSATISNEQSQPAAFDKKLEPDADVPSGDSCTSTNLDSQPINFQNDSIDHLSTSKVALSSQKKRYFREEWKIVTDDEKATNDRLCNLVINSQDSWGMWCKVCTEWAPKISPKFCTNFVKNYPSFKPPRPKRETVNSHFSSAAHAKCLEKEKAFEKSPTKAPIYQKLIQIDESTLKKMTCLMRIVFYFAMKDRSALEFPSECALQKLNGVDLGTTYQNKTSFLMLLQYVANSLQSNVIKTLNNAKFIAVMTDGSSTKKSTEYEAVSIRHVDETNAKIMNSFVGLCKVENGDAAGLCNIISKRIKDAGIEEWEKKLICTTVDGASVNIGRHKGLVKLMDSPVYIHCFNHVLDLCLKESIKNNNAANKAMTLLKTVSSFYRTSPKLTRELFNAGEALDLDLLSFKAVCETRWANSLDSCVATIVRNYAAVVQHLTDITSPHAPTRYTSNIRATAKGLLSELTTYEVVRFFYGFSDFVSVFSEASKYLEKADLNILDATECIKETEINLVDFGSSGDLRSSNRKNLLSFLTNIDDTQEEIITFKNIELKKQKGKKNSQSEDNFKELCLKASSSVNKRFFNNSNSGAYLIVRTAKVLNTAYFPTEITNSSDFGESEIGEFATLFNFPMDRVLAEWRELRTVMSEHFRPSIALHDLFVKLQTDAFKTMRLLAEIVAIILTIPASNAEVERIWSSVSHTLDDKSLSMGQETLEYRLQVKRSKVSLDNFDPTGAVNLWWSDTVRCRRPDFTK